jgi:hypothetical protein
VVSTYRHTSPSSTALPCCYLHPAFQVLYEQFFDTEEELPIQLNHIVNARYKACLAQVSEADAPSEAWLGSSMPCTCCEPPAGWLGSLDWQLNHSHPGELGCRPDAQHHIHQTDWC